MSAMKNDTFRKSGYLYEDFRIFHNADQRIREIPFHYHDFHKLVLFLSGNVSYVVEGRRYDLQPLDLLPISAGQIHRPVIHDASLYERIIIYIAPRFFDAFREEDIDLFGCFSSCAETNSSRIRLEDPAGKHLAGLGGELKRCASDTGSGAALLRRLKLTELLLLVNRSLLRRENVFAGETASHPSILQAIEYINRNLTDESLSVDSIARETALNRSYLMHLFREQTGYTIGGYIKEKRLFQAASLMENGASVTEACYSSGFRNYAAFYYAYRKKYSASPAGGHRTERQIVGE